MCCEQGVVGQRAGGFKEIDSGRLSALRQAMQGSLPEGASTERLWLLGNTMCVAMGTADGHRGCVTIPHIGIPIRLCWEFLSLNVSLPSIDVRVKVSVSVAGTQFFSAVLHFRCGDIANPSGCTVSVENEVYAHDALRASCDWGCLRGCAPQCISCGSNYWCWAACAAGCVVQCCSL